MTTYFLTTAISLYWNLATGDSYLAESSDDFWLIDFPKGTHLIFDDADQCELGDYSFSLYPSLQYLEKDFSKNSKLAELLAQIN